MRRSHYKHVLSMGKNCVVAQELGRYGFREASYPLDWVISPLAPTLALLESGFQHLAQPGSLVRDPVNDCVVHDVVSGIHFYHDFDPVRTVEAQADAVREKYARRSRRWCAAITERTLFVRFIMNQDEFDYLDYNMEAVLTLLRRSNPLNDLLLVGVPPLPPTCGGIDLFRVEVDESVTVLRFVNKNRRLQLKLLTLPYPLATRIRNYLRYTLGTRSYAQDRIRAALRRPACSLLGEDRLVRLLASVRNFRSEA